MHKWILIYLVTLPWPTSGTSSPILLHNTMYRKIYESIGVLVACINRYIAESLWDTNGNPWPRNLISVHCQTSDIRHTLVSNKIVDHSDQEYIWRWPEQANFEEIGPENDLAYFLSVHSTNPYSVDVAEPQKKQVAFATGKKEKSGFLIFAMGGLMRILSQRVEGYVINR